jgi:hypothetical protein
MLRTDVGECTIDVKRDKGASMVINWLKDVGWDIEAAIQQAQQTPLVRTAAYKAR